ncbi:MAG TPA: hypothetical protein VG387_17135 [Rhizomicrobium sp.]|nr:hypothetical protein [Rhizomicrobium sp.]
MSDAPADIIQFRDDGARMAEQRPYMGAARREGAGVDAMQQPVAVAGLAAAPARRQTLRFSQVLAHPPGRASA